VQISVLVVPPAARVVAVVLRVVSRSTLVLLALHHAPLVLPSLYDASAYEPLAPARLLRVLAVVVALPELGVWLVRRRVAATARVEAGALVIESGGRRDAVPLAEIAGAAPWALSVPWPGLRLRSRSGEPVGPPLAAADPSVLLAALVGAGAEPLRAALSQPAVRRARARARVRGPLDHPLVKFVGFALVPAVPLFRLHQRLGFGDAFGELHAFGLRAYLVGFGLYWILSAVYLLLFAALLRALGEAGALVGARALPGRELAVRRAVEVGLRATYYLAPPVLLVVRLALS
jgi:apolipoprotein N-acyltransferase